MPNPAGSQSLVSAYADIRTVPPGRAGPDGVGVGAILASNAATGVLVGRMVASGGGVCVGVAGADGTVAATCGAAAVTAGATVVGCSLSPQAMIVSSNVTAAMPSISAGLMGNRIFARSYNLD